MSNKQATMAILLLLCTAMAAVAGGEAQLTCSTVLNTLTPCYSFIMGPPGNPTKACCNGAKSLFKPGKTPGAVEARKTVCSCLKNMASIATPDQMSRAASLPGKCGIAVPFKISTQIDCSTIH